MIDRLDSRKNDWIAIIKNETQKGHIVSVKWVFQQDSCWIIEFGIWGN